MAAVSIEKVTGPWREWSVHVLLELERLNTNMSNLRDKLDELVLESSNEDSKLRTELQTLKDNLDDAKAATAALDKFFKTSLAAREANCKLEAAKIASMQGGCKVLITITITIILGILGIAIAIIRGWIEKPKILKPFPIPPAKVQMINPK